ncbi:MAG: ATP-binding cassette domain-containing protein [Candidatus Competibacteraceae bacterium]|jgi:tungstate transport system ATP-binding protein|nr:ATP-binding cassette domain-containing protein [Candidatus Competibacteraceae bacterium]
MNQVLSLTGEWRVLAPIPTPILPLALEAVSFEARGEPLLNRISLCLEAGPITIVMGPNGAGKSLLLRVCHGLLQPTGGAVTWANNDSKLVRQAQAMVFQRPVLLRRSVAANVEYALSACGQPRRFRKVAVAEILEQAGLLHLAKRSARVLSGGEQQRLALARAWAMKPQLLFLDEPSSNLDPAATRMVEDMIRRIHQDGTKIVMTTHDLGQARRLADEVIFLHGGHLLERTAAQAFFAAPKSQAAAAFLDGQLCW